MKARALPLCLLALALLVITGGVGTAAPSITPRPLGASHPNIDPKLLSQIASGVARIRVRGCRGGGGSGTGFLIGSQVVMTAWHVVKGGCSFRITLGGRSYTAERVAPWYTTGTRDLDAADVATFKLDRPAPGYVFSFARRTPRIKTTIAVVGFPLGNPLSLNQGPLVLSRRVNGVPALGVRIATAKGSSGSAFLNPAGEVVGILQQGAVWGPGEGGIVTPAGGIVLGLNLVRWWGPQILRDLCRAHPNGRIPGCSGGAAPANCQQRDRAYLNKLAGPWNRFVDRWDAWIDAGNPPDSSVGPVVDALEGVVVRSIEQQHLACSRGTKRVLALLRALLPTIDRIEAALSQIPLDPVEVDSLTTLLDVQIEEVVAELEALGFFRGGG